MKTKTYSYKVASPLTTAKTKIKSAVRKETLPQIKQEVDPEDEFNENFKRYQFLMNERKGIDSELEELKKYFRPQLKAQEQDGEGNKLYNQDETAYFTFSTQLIYEYPEEIRLQEVELTQRKKILDNTKKAQVLMKRAVLIGRERKLRFYTKR
tara:strand:+ start:133 stop:591 length:459 start_codon:yes stop_codon:yes gene_type:complete